MSARPSDSDASDERADDVVRRPERHAQLDERVGDRGRRRVAVGRRLAHPRLVDDAASPTIPAITRSDDSSTPSPSNSGGLSSWRSRW